MMKQALQKILSRAGLRLVRIHPYVDPIAPFDVLDLVVQVELSRASKSFYFVKIGASDGILARSLNLLIRKYGLRGCLVEPNKVVLSELASHLSDQAQLEFRAVMIGTHGAPRITHARPGVARGAGYFDALPGVDRDSVPTSAEVVSGPDADEVLDYEMQTFSALMASLPVDKISMLHVDTEGVDDLIVEAAFEASVFPTIISYGWTEMSAERRFLLKMRLLDNGYRFIDTGADTVCLRGVLE